ncbi:MAG: hypothetical protein A2882_03260 [Phenylobacterium sp. RIFCSPHIGHO2_01_FULL_70_10]|nr:MAG: hypothetical protein A2882_03260 [Phenylobacterium sp. RIFCSPHIGHO2_01_FULL_70_10]
MGETGPDQSIELTMDRIEREAKRAARAKELQERFGAAGEGRMGPAAEADALAQRIAQLTGCHRIPYRPRDWAGVAAKPRIQVVRTNDREMEARRALNAYRPGWLEQLFGSDREKRRQLAARVAEAVTQDEQAYREAWREAQKHNGEIDFACKLAELDMRTINEALSEHTTLPAAYDAVDRFRFCSPAKGRFQIQIEAHDLAGLPCEEAERQPGGRAVFRPMPRGRLHQLHGANVCASALRFAVEMLGFLPLDEVEVVTHCDLRNPNTGLFERHPILQMKLTHAVAARTPFEKAEPIALAAQVGARMNWTLQAGFSPISLDGLEVDAA